MLRLVWHLVIFFAALASASAGSLTNIGRHPTSPQTAYPSIHALKRFGDRIYLTYGDWNGYPAVALVSYEPRENSFRVEFSANTDSVGHLREWNGRLYAPSVDPIHYEDFHDYTVLDPAVGWRDRAPWGCYHVFDVAASGSDIFAVGSKQRFENSGADGGIIWRSTDGERTWTAVRSVATPSRYYWCFSHDGRLYVQDGDWRNGNFSSSNTFSSYETLYKPTPLLIDGAESVIALASGTPGIVATAPTSLLAFKNGILRTIASSAFDFTWAEGALWILTGNREVLRATTLLPTPDWTVVPITNVPSAARVLEVHNGVLYIGDALGFLHAARLDEAPLTLPPLTITSIVPDAFGRALSLHNGQLAIGAPDFSAATPVAGRAQLFRQPAGGNAWALMTTLDPPAPRFSGWFAKDIALLDDVMAVVEAGYDSRGDDRGSAARVHVYQNRDAAWLSVQILSIPFAHSAALLGDMLVVGTSNPAANQFAGRPGVNPFRITRDATGVITLTAQPQLAPRLNAFGYKSTARVALGGDLLIGGFSGDVSRGGAPGMISVFARDPSGTVFNATPAQEIASNKPDRFGFALSYDGDRLAVGAPRDDATASQAGAVHVYFRGGGTFVLEQTIVSPVREPEANFGHSVALRGNMLLIGAPGASIDGIRQRGAVFVFKRAEGNWRSAGQLHPPSGVLGQFGIEVAMDADWLAAGSRFSDAAAALTERVALAGVRPAFDTWAAEKGLAGADAAAAADLDEDGLSNLVEFATLLDPRVSDAGVVAGSGSPRGLPRPSFDFQGANPRLVVTFARRVNDPRLNTFLEVSVDLTIWQRAVNELVTSSVQAGTELRTVTVQPPSQTSRFFLRLRTEYTF